MASSNRQEAGKPLSNARLEQIYSAGDYLSEPSDPQTYGSCTNIEAMRLVNMVRARDRQIEVYRKALEPFATAAIDRLAPALEDIRPQDQEMDLVVWLDRQERDALREACRLMGIPLAADSGDAP